MTSFTSGTISCVAIKSIFSHPYEMRTPGPRPNLNDNDGFNSREYGIITQKEVLGKKSKKPGSQLLSESAGCLLDRLYLIIRRHCGSKQIADDLMMDLVETIIKVSALYRYKRFHGQQQELAFLFRKKLRMTIMAVISFAEIDFSFDLRYLTKALTDLHQLLQGMASAHLSEHSLDKTDNVYLFLCDPVFVSSLFRADGHLRDQLDELVVYLHALLQNDTL